MASFNITLNEYLDYVKKDEFMNVEDVIDEMVGEITLIMKAPQYGLQGEELVPDEVMNSYNKIVSSGYNKYFYTDETVKSFKDKMIKNGLK